MAEDNKALWLPWMCAGLVLSVELFAKGPLVALIVGLSSLALFEFLLVALKILATADSPVTEPPFRNVDAEADEIVFEHIQIEKMMFLKREVSPDLA
jgi:hypothetical protein